MYGIKSTIYTYMIEPRRKDRTMNIALNKTRPLYFIMILYILTKIYGIWFNLEMKIPICGIFLDEKKVGT